MRHSTEETASEAVIVLTAGRSSAPSIHPFPPRRSARECASDRPDVIASAAASVSTALLPMLVGDRRERTDQARAVGGGAPGGAPAGRLAPHMTSRTPRGSLRRNALPTGTAGT